MKLAMNMIRQYADIPVTPEEYSERMIMTGTAVEGVEDIAAHIHGALMQVGAFYIFTGEDTAYNDLFNACVDDGATAH